MRHWVMALAALVVAVPASAQVTLTPGHSVAVTIDAQGKMKAGPVREAEPAPHDLEALAQSRTMYETQKPASGEIAPAVPMNGGQTPLPPIPAERVSIFYFVTSDESMLILQNGYGRGVTYRATITARGQSAPTDVCLVMPGRRGVEHWPYVIDKIELSEFTFEDWNPDQPLPCR